MNKKAQYLHDVLQTASDRLYPYKTSRARVKINSRGSMGDTPLHVFIWANETEKANFLIENGADVNAKGVDETPLHVAIKLKNVQIVQKLLYAGAKTNIKSEFGKTALDLAGEIGIKVDL